MNANSLIHLIQAIQTRTGNPNVEIQFYDNRASQPVDLCTIADLSGGRKIIDNIDQILAPVDHNACIPLEPRL